jgi:choline monooxygenase
MARIDADIGKAWTLPSAVYRDPALYRQQLERVFARSWQFAGDATRLKAPGHVLPFTLLEGCLDEPLFLSRDPEGVLHCVSNVCTHRGALVVEGEGHVNSLRCRYHGRRFQLDGRFASMPEFDGVAGFPGEADDLPRLRLEQWGPFLFTAIRPDTDFEAWIGPMRERLDWLPLDRFVFDRASSRDYLIHANWALYCDNYLEEFHIPYVHGASLGGTLDYGAYRTELFRYSNLQLGVGRATDTLFELPPGHPDEGTPMAAYYWWLFPNLMFNFYPTRISVNVVTPLGVDRTRVSFLTYLLEDGRAAGGPDADLHRVEMEDEEIVESVQRGVRSRLYDRGRYSPRREVGTHHFHRLLLEFMDQEEPAR